MTIASEITKLNTNLTNSYTACQSKGATMPTDQNFDNLATCISSIQTGGSPNLQTKSVSLTDKNGQTFSADNGYDGLSQITVTPNNEARTVTPTTSNQSLIVNSGYSGNGTITVNAVTSAIDNNITASNIKKDVTILGVTGSYEGGGSFTGINREVVSGTYKAPTTSFTWSLPSTATDVGNYAMNYAFRDCSGLTSVDLSSLTTVSGSNAMNYAFYGCRGLTSVDLSSLTTVSGNYAMNYAFYECYSLRGALNLSSLTTVSGTNTMYYAFYGCLGLTSVDLSSLTTVSTSQAMYSAFYGCTHLTSVDLSSLTTVSGNSAMSYAFYGCTGLTSVLFTNLETIGTNTSSTNNSHFTQCFNNCNALTSITFPNLEKIYCTGGTTTSYGTFAYNNKVQKMYFPKLDTITYGSGASTSNQNACKNIFYGCAALTELHFAAANQSAIEATAGYSTAWGRGAGNVTIYFDL